ncbi:hypothetical protein LWI28_009833 [Acer negundo]|uniref:Uncharacterized protein n=1 Tax=Acer negundo TaxID=4023 RepID=A0AAD5NRT2_ACENE|nr:hypothetical protein LWI28_009833 [Acer negundo]
MELDYQPPNDMDCTADSEKYMKRIAEDSVYMFLVGLAHNLDQVSSRVLATSPLPSLEEAYSLKGNFRPAPPIGPLTRLCTHYNSITHMVDAYWKKHDYSECYKLTDVSLVSLQGEISSKRNDYGWKKKVWILGKGEDSTIICEGESLDTSDPVEAESTERERPGRLLKKCYTRRNKGVTVDSITPPDDTTMPSDNSSANDPVL